MEKPTKAMLIATAVVLAAAIALHLGVWLDETCYVGSRRVLMKTSGAVGCFEFWLNRYQGLIGNVLTAAVAAATLYWIAGQLKTADRQAAAAAAASLRTYADELEVEVQSVSSALKNCVQQWTVFNAQMAKYIDEDNAIASCHKMLGELSVSLERLTTTLIADTDKHFPSEIDDALMKFLHSTTRFSDLKSGLEQFSQEAMQMRSPRPANEDNAQLQADLRSTYDAGREWLRRLRVASNELWLAAERYHFALSAEKSRAWAQIRQFEHASISGASR